MLKDYVRPGIDDRPDYDKALSEEDKIAVNRLAAPMPKQRAREGALGNEQFQMTVISTASRAPGSGFATISGIDTAVPDTDSSFLDMFDPMAAADGHRPSRTEMIRFNIGFLLVAVACAIPWCALSDIILPRVLEQMNAPHKIGMLALANALGACCALISAMVCGTLSDMTRSRFGRRTPWIVVGGVLTGACMGLSAIADNIGWIITLWCLAQFSYNMMLAPLIAVLADRVPDKVRGRSSSFYGTGVAVGQMLGSILGAILLCAGIAGEYEAWMIALGIFALSGIGVVLIWPKEANNRNEARSDVYVDAFLNNFRFPRHARNYMLAFFGRLSMMTGYWAIGLFLLYIVEDYVLVGEQDQMPIATAWIMALMGVLSFIFALVASLVAGAIYNRHTTHARTVALSCCILAVAACIPLFWRSGVGMMLFAAIAGFGYGIFNSIDQALCIEVLPDPDGASKDLGLLGLTNTLGVIGGAVLTAIITTIIHAIANTNSMAAYRAVFVAAIVMTVLAAVLFACIKGTQSEQ